MTVLTPKSGTAQPCFLIKITWRGHDHANKVQVNITGNYYSY